MNQQNIINPSVYSGYLTCVKKIESILFTSGLADGNIEMDLFIFFSSQGRTWLQCVYEPLMEEDWAAVMPVSQHKHSVALWWRCFIADCVHKQRQTKKKYKYKKKSEQCAAPVAALALHVCDSASLCQRASHRAPRMWQWTHKAMRNIRMHRCVLCWQPHWP